MKNASKIKGWLFAAIAVMLVVAIGAGLPARSQTEKAMAPVADDVVARVNGEVITERDLYEAMVRRFGGPVLDQLITERLILQAAEEAGVEVAAEDVEAELAQVRSQLPSGMSLEEALETSGLTMEQLLNEIRLNLLVRQLLADRVEITEEEMKEFFAQYKDFLGTEERVRVRHILVSTEEEANKIREELLAGADFADLARRHSQDPGSAQRGGDLGWISRNQMVKPFEDVAFSTPVGEISPVVQTDFGYHVLLVEERQEAKEAVYEESREEIRGYLMEDKLEEAYRGWVQQLRDSARVETYL